MILSVGLNTSIDKAYIVDSFEVGGVTRVKDVISTAGGKGLNVAKTISALGQKVLATGFIGGFSGMFIQQELKKKHIPFEFIHINEETRNCINIIDKNTHTEFLEPGPNIRDEKINEFINLYKTLVTKCDVITLSGSIPRGLSADIYAELIRIAKNRGKKTILDTSGYLLNEGIKASPTLIKPNKFEAEQLLGKKLQNLRDILLAAQELLERGPDIVAISLGSKGVVVADKSTKKFYKGTPPKIQPINTVGCGDAMVAGFALGLHKTLALEDSIRYAIAVATAAALSPVTGEVEVDGIKSIMENLALERFD